MASPEPASKKHGVLSPCAMGQGERMAASGMAGLAPWRGRYAGRGRQAWRLDIQLREKSRVALAGGLSRKNPGFL